MRPFAFARIVLTAVAALAAMPLAGNATALPAASFTAEAGLNGEQLIGPSATPLSQTGSCFGFSQSLEPNPTVDATVSLHGSDGSPCEADSQVVYDFMVAGPAFGAVPVLLSAVLHATAGELAGDPFNGAFAKAQFRLTPANSPLDLLFLLSVDCSINNNQLTVTSNVHAPQCGDNFVTVNKALTPNTIYQLTIEGIAGATEGTADALVDSSIAIDSDFPFADQLSLTLSDGVGNPPLSPVPEPPSLALFGGALLILALQASIGASRNPLRSRRRPASPRWRSWVAA